MAQALHPQAFDLIEPHLQHSVLRVRFLDYLTKVDHPRRQQVLLREFEGSADQLEREALARALVSRASKADQPAMLRALRACEDDEFSGAIICGWFVRNPMPEATALMKERMGQDFSRSTRFLFSVAMLGDEDVVRWAERGMREEDTRVGAVYALAYSPTAAADTIVRKIIAGSDMECLPLLVYALAQDGDHSNPNRWERLREIAALPDKSSNLRAALAQSLGRINAPQAKELLRVIEATSRPSTTQAKSAASRPKGR